MLLPVPAVSRSANRSSEIWPCLPHSLLTPALRDNAAQGPGVVGAAYVDAGSYIFKRGTPTSRPTGGGVIEITISVRLVQTAVEITKVVARKGDELWGAICAGQSGHPTEGKPLAAEMGIHATGQ